jgi:UDP-N-acetyl-D-mannosaminuronic acid dehydrogenase
LTTDPYVQGDPALLPLDEVVRRSDVLILCAPHRVYRDLKLDHEIIVDIWNFWGRGSLFTRARALSTPVS